MTKISSRRSRGIANILSRVSSSGITVTSISGASGGKYLSNIHVRATRNHSLSQRQEAQAGGGKPEEEQDSSSHRACVWSSGDLSRQPARTDDRHRQSASEDRIAEPRVQHPPPRDAGADGCSMREKAACATLNRTPGAYGGAAPASDHLPIARRSAQANDHAAKTLLFEVPIRHTCGLIAQLKMNVMLC